MGDRGHRLDVGLAQRKSLGRRTFVAGLAAGPIALGAAACTSSPPSAHEPGGRPTAALGPSFTRASTYRPFAVVAPQFVAVSEHETKGAGITVSNSSPAAPYAAIELDVINSNRSTVVLGLATASGDHLFAKYNSAARRIGIELRLAGRSTSLTQRRVALPAAVRLGLVLCENQVTVVADAGNGWEPLLTERARVAAAVDFRIPETLARYRFAWGALPHGAPAHLGTVRAGLFGMAGVRDPHLVQHTDGRQYERDGKVYLTATCAGMGSFRQAHWGVFTLNLSDPTRLEPVGKLFAARGGLVLGDHAGQLVRDESAKRWIVLNSSWGDFGAAGVHVRHASTSEDILSGVHLLATERVPLPTTHSTWDPGLTKIDGTWNVSYVDSPSQHPFDFHPALASSSQPDWTADLRLVGAATSLHECEGPIITEIDGQWRVLASDRQHRQFPAFDMRMRQLGHLDAPYPTNIPHPQIVTLPDRSHLMVTFNGKAFGKSVLGYGTHGDVIFLHSN